MTDNNGIGQQPESLTPSTCDLLSPNRFKVVISRFPNTNYFTQRVPIPTVTLGATIMPTNRETDIKFPGDKVEYEDLIISIIVDEDLAGFKEILDWLQDCADEEKLPEDIFSDISIIALTNNSNRNKVFKFYNAFPQTISNILLDTTATEDQPLTVDVIFKFSHYTLD